MSAASSRHSPRRCPAVILLLLSAPFFAACASSSPRPQAETLGLPLEAGLPGVHVGMSYAELVRLRLALKSFATGVLLELGQPNPALQEDLLEERFSKESRFEDATYMIKAGRLTGFAVSKEYSSTQAMRQAVAPYAAACLRAWGPNFRRRSPPPARRTDIHASLVWTSGTVERVLGISAPCTRDENFCISIGVEFAKPSPPGTRWDQEVDAEAFKRIGLDDDALKGYRN